MFAHSVLTRREEHEGWNTFGKTMFQKIPLDIKLKQTITFPSPSPTPGGLKCHEPLISNNKWKKKNPLTHWYFTLFRNKGGDVPLTASSTAQIQRQAGRQASTLAGNKATISLIISSLRSNIGLKPIVILLLTSWFTAFGTEIVLPQRQMDKKVKATLYR